MKTALPEPDKYYRPTRARELREQAGRLEQRRKRGTATFVAAATLSPILVGFLMTVGSVVDSPRAIASMEALAGWLCAAGSMVAVVAGPYAYLRGEKARRLFAEAAALEAEHAARYGGLPPGEET